MWWLVAVSSKWQGGYSASHHQPRQPSSGYNIQSLCPLPSPRHRLSPISLSTLLPPNPLLTCHFSPLCPRIWNCLYARSPEKFTIAGSWQLGRCTGLRIAVSNVALCLVCNALFAQFLHEFTQAWHYGVTTCLISANFSAMELQITSSTCTTLGARKGKLRLEILNCFYEDEF